MSYLIEHDHSIKCNFSLWPFITQSPRYPHSLEWAAPERHYINANVRHGKKPPQHILCVLPFRVAVLGVTGS